jgi:predicted transcriptional regulator
MDDVFMIEVSPRRNPFQDVVLMGELLKEKGYLSVSTVQRKLKCGFTTASRWLDFLMDIGELEYHPENHRYTSLRQVK